MEIENGEMRKWYLDMKARATGEMPLVKFPRKKANGRRISPKVKWKKGKRDPVYPNQWNCTVRKIPDENPPIESLRRPSTPPPKANKEHSDESSENIYLFT